jgi:acyl-coenzyme A synthetase/AMP-(fatty) acid ligase
MLRFFVAESVEAPRHSGILTSVKHRRRRTENSLNTPPSRSIPSPCVPADFRPFPIARVGAMSIWNRFEEIREAYGERPAVVDGGTALDYRALMRMTNTLATRLQRMKLPGHAMAAIVLDTDWRSAPAVLALTRCGITFVPIDGSLPPERIGRLVRACGASLVVAGARHADMMAGAWRDVVVLVLDDPLGAPDRASGEPAAGEQVCHLLTSGTTGNPKRVIYTPGMILHDVAVRTNSLAVSASDRFAQVIGGTSLPLMTLFLALLNGASVHFHDIKRRGLAPLLPWIAESGVSVLRLTPTLFRAVARNIDASCFPGRLRLVSTGGERLTAEDVRLFRERFPAGPVLLNHLSSTECRVVCQCFIEHGTRMTSTKVPVGWTVDDIDVVIADANGMPAPPGTVGEIIVRSKWITPGYFDSAGRRVFLPRDENTGVITHHTGDLGLMHENGCIEHHGRKDRMVKIRGYRIELDEVEAILRPMESVEQVAALVYEDSENQSSLAVFIAGKSLRATAGSIRRKVFKDLGLFGMPQRVEVRRRLPVTANGKIDRAALARELARSHPPGLPPPESGRPRSS